MHNESVELHDEAATEYDEAFDWYLDRSPDAAHDFDSEFEHALAEIARSPRRWVAGSHGTRRFLLRKFPFVLIYRERATGEIQVIALAHTSRRPGYWKNRL
jgi:toxin ParE1/3/4